MHDPDEGNNVVADIISMNDRNVEMWDLNYRTLFFSSEKKGFDTVPEVEADGIQGLLKYLN